MHTRVYTCMHSNVHVLVPVCPFNPHVHRYCHETFMNRVSAFDSSEFPVSQIFVDLTVVF